MNTFLVTVIGAIEGAAARMVNGSVTIQARDAKRARAVALALPPDAITWDSDDDPARIVEVQRIEVQS